MSIFSVAWNIHGLAANITALSWLWWFITLELQLEAWNWAREYEMLVLNLMFLHLCFPGFELQMPFSMSLWKKAFNMFYCGTSDVTIMSYWRLFWRKLCAIWPLPLVLEKNKAPIKKHFWSWGLYGFKMAWADFLGIICSYSCEVELVDHGYMLFWVLTS